MTDLKTLETEYDDAQVERVALTDARNNKREALLRAAREQIDADLEAEFGEKTRVARRVETERRQALEAARIAAAQAAQVFSNYRDAVLVEWGTRQHTWYDRDEIRPLYPTGRRGVLEICTADSEFPQNHYRWNLPAVGDVFIRLIKKDGKKGLGYVKMNGQRVPITWHPDGEPPPNAGKD